MAASRRTEEEPADAGQSWLRRHLQLDVPQSAVRSFCVPGSRRTVHDGNQISEFYPPRYWPGDTAMDHLKFSLKYEPLDLRIIVATFHRLPPTDLLTWIRKAPTSKYSRQIWFLYERLTGQILDLPDLTTGPYVPAIDPQRHVAAKPVHSPRHRIYDNLIGGGPLAVIIRRTKKLETLMSVDIEDAVRAVVDLYDPDLIRRATSYLFTKETRSSFAIEGERPSSLRTERFISALRRASDFDPIDTNAIIALQNQIVDPRYAAKGWRDVQNFVGETTPDYSERIHYICPQPADVPSLMRDWQLMAYALEEDATIPAVLAAAIVSFAFVFIHPFEDGNGRIHRFLINNVLARRKAIPEGFIFPVSASILRHKHEYDRVLELFSRPLLDIIDWRYDGRTLTVENDTALLYRYFDATAQAEFLYERVIDTIANDLREELRFLSVFDKATAAMREIVDMPDRRLHLFFKLCLQNAGRLSRGRRDDFPELTDGEIAALEQAIADARAEG
ncbi:Fic family protein [Zavarzinia sp.]|uniref:Fic family protein n=1 Tax=Zavarzinia sp. TaxID=2027920 RepID=UPI003BB73624